MPRKTTSQRKAEMLKKKKQTGKTARERAKSKPSGGRRLTKAEGTAKKKAAMLKKKKEGTGSFGSGTSQTRTHKGKKLANVSREQLKKSGLSLRQYMNQWKKTGKRPK